MLEDYDTTFDWMLFGEDYSRYDHVLEPGQFILATVQVVERFTQKDGEKQYGIKPLNIIYLSDAYTKVCTKIRIHIAIKDVSENLANIIKDTVEKSRAAGIKADRGPGRIPIILTIVANEQEFTMDFYNYQVKVDAESFVELFPKDLPCKLSLE